jgi:hypothetical protein
LVLIEFIAAAAKKWAISKPVINGYNPAVWI